MGSIWPAKMVGATAQYLETHNVKEQVSYKFSHTEQNKNDQDMQETRIQ